MAERRETRRETWLRKPREQYSYHGDYDLWSDPAPLSTMEVCVEYRPDQATTYYSTYADVRGKRMKVWLAISNEMKENFRGDLQRMIMDKLDEEAGALEGSAAYEDAVLESGRREARWERQQHQSRQEIKERILGQYEVFKRSE